MINNPYCTPFDPFPDSCVYVVCFGCLSTLIFNSEDLPIHNERILVNTIPNTFLETKRLFGKDFKNHMIWNFSTGQLININYENIKFTLAVNSHNIDQGQPFESWIIPIYSLSKSVKRLVELLGEDLIDLEHEKHALNYQIHSSPHDYSFPIFQQEISIPPNIKYYNTINTICETRGHTMRFSKFDLFRFCFTCHTHFPSDYVKQKDLVYQCVLKFLLNNDFTSLGTDFSASDYIKS